MVYCKVIKATKKDFDYAVEKIGNRESQFYKVENDDDSDEPEFYRTLGATVSHIFEYEDNTEVLMRPDHDAKDGITVMKHLSLYGYVKFDIGPVTFKITTYHFFG